MFEEAKVCSPEVQACELAFGPAPSSQNPELSYLMLPAARTAFYLRIPSKTLLVDENDIQQSTSPHWLLCHMGEEVVIDVSQELPRLLMPCCVVPVADIGVAQVPHEYLGL